MISEHKNMCYDHNHVIYVMDNQPSFARTILLTDDLPVTVCVIGIQHSCN